MSDYRIKKVYKEILSDHMKFLNIKCLYDLLFITKSYLRDNPNKLNEYKKYKVSRGDYQNEKRKKSE